MYVSASLATIRAAPWSRKIAPNAPADSAPIQACPPREPEVERRGGQEDAARPDGKVQHGLGAVHEDHLGGERHREREEHDEGGREASR